MLSVKVKETLPDIFIVVKDKFQFLAVIDRLEKQGYYSYDNIQSTKIPKQGIIVKAWQTILSSTGKITIVNYTDNRYNKALVNFKEINVDDFIKDKI